MRLIALFVMLSVLFFIPVPKAFQQSLGSAVLNTGHIVFFCLFGFAVSSTRQLSLRLTWLLLVMIAIVIERMPLVHELMHNHT